MIEEAVYFLGKDSPVPENSYLETPMYFLFGYDPFCS